MKPDATARTGSGGGKAGPAGGAHLSPQDDDGVLLFSMEDMDQIPAPAPAPAPVPAPTPATAPSAEAPAAPVLARPSGDVGAAIGPAHDAATAPAIPPPQDEDLRRFRAGSIDEEFDDIVVAAGAAATAAGSGNHSAEGAPPPANSSAAPLQPDWGGF